MEEKALALIRTAVGLTVAMLYWPSQKHMNKSDIESALRNLLDRVGESWLLDHPSLFDADTGKLSVSWREGVCWFSKEDITALAQRCIPPREAYLCLHTAHSYNQTKTQL